ncbi:MAG: hypothetical protein KatS3mg106_683 [Gemmataceae bacterium]|jgi:hypothetical protein|nr:MAG: hypothetical protein KatS3mg106_683 [Gemmataceae bacterium]
MRRDDGKVGVAGWLKTEVHPLPEARPYHPFPQVFSKELFD